MQYNKLGKFINYKRKLLGITLNKFAFDNDIDPAISSIPTLVLIANALNIKLMSLFEFDE